MTAVAESRRFRNGGGSPAAGMRAIARAPSLPTGTPMATYVLLLLLAGVPQAVQPDPARAGWEAIQRGDGEKAASAFREVLAANPHDVRALTGAGLAAHLLGRDDQAVTSLTRALQVDADNVYASYLLGQIAYSQGDLDLAIKSYERVVKNAPRDAATYKQLEAWKKEAALHGTFAARPGVRFTVMFEGPAQQPVADRVSGVLEAAYVRIGKTLNAYPLETVTAILYTRQQFRDITKSPSWAAAAYDGRIRIPVQEAMKNPAELDRVVTHEFVHALIQQTTPRIPGWLNEGLATYLEPGDHTWLTSRLRSAGSMIPLAALDEAFRTADGEEAALAYAQSYVGARVLAERLGSNFPVFLQYLSNGTSLDQALLLFNISASDVEREWTRRARAAR
jgi:tetratricopeptide (TPR) repeat protein